MKRLANPLVLYPLILVIALVPIIIFGSWVWVQDWELEQKISAWDPFIKIMAIVGAIIAAIAAVERFLDQRRRELAHELMEKNRERLRPLTEAQNVVSRLANADSLSGPEQSKDVSAFWRLYWGDLIGLEGPQVAQAMIGFGEALKEWQKDNNKPSNIVPLCRDVSRACTAEVEAHNRQTENVIGQYSGLVGLLIAPSRMRDTE